MYLILVIAVSAELWNISSHSSLCSYWPFYFFKSELWTYFCNYKTYLIDGIAENEYFSHSCSCQNINLPNVKYVSLFKLSCEYVLPWANGHVPVWVMCLCSGPSLRPVFLSGFLPSASTLTGPGAFLFVSGPLNAISQNIAFFSFK